MNEIVLAGCTATPLAGYLKALGVLRLLSARCPETRGFWRGEQFVLRTPLDREGIEQFFLREYSPTPIIAPWNAGSGFYYQERKSKETDPSTGKKKKLGVFDRETTATKVVTAIVHSGNPRLTTYRQVLAQAKTAVQNAGLTTAPDSGSQKDEFILCLRATLPDQCVQAMDAGLVVSGGTTSFPPLLGSGWNDGNLDFTSNLMQRVIDVIGTHEGAVPPQSHPQLCTSLFGATTPELTKDNIGQFSPGQAGGYNASTGFDADALIDPWDFVLMIEGSLLFAASATRRNSDSRSGAMSYPFCVRTVSAGSGSLGESDSSNDHTRGEIWMPLWPQPSTCSEIQALMAEGRVALGRKPAKDALDFARAVQHLGGYRGVRSFQRYGLLKRNGKAFFAAPLSRITVGDTPQSRWIDELDRNNWLERFRRFANDGNTAVRFKSLRKRLEDQLFVLSGHTPHKAEAQSLLVLLGEIQTSLATSTRTREAVRPIPRLSERWVIAADDDNTPTFRIAKSLAGLRGVGEQPLPLRAQLFPMQRRFDQWMTPEAGEKFRICDGQQGRLINTLPALLSRRLWLADMLEMNDKPLASPAGAMLDDIAAFLRDKGMDSRIAELLPGLALCDIPPDIDHAAGEGAVPAAFALLKLCLTPNRILHSLHLLPEDERMPVPTGMLAQLAAGNHGNRAVSAAWRRLRASGLAPLFMPGSLPTLAGIDPRRAAAALLIPLRIGATRQLANAVLKQPKPESA
ncbi:MAG: type I-G CRISPR-associated protein Cas8g1/Csx17 [Rhodanobacteraceae bacterium]